MTPIESHDDVKDTDVAASASRSPAVRVGPDQSASDPICDQQNIGRAMTFVSAFNKRT